MIQPDRDGKFRITYGGVMYEADTRLELHEKVARVEHGIKWTDRSRRVLGEFIDHSGMEEVDGASH